MRRLAPVLTALAVMLRITTACTVEEGEGPLPPAPVITLDSETSIYTTKTGRTIEIRPTITSPDEATTYLWMLDDGTSLGDTPTLLFTSDEAGRYYITLTVTNRGGSASKELRIDVLALAPPQVSLPGAEEGFTLLEGSTLLLQPTLGSDLKATYRWLVDGIEVSTEERYTFVGSETGDYLLTLTVTNEDGSETIECTIRVRTPEQVDFSWTFAQDRYHVALGRTIRLEALDLTNAFDARYTWRVDGTIVQQGEEPCYCFTAALEGEHDVLVEMQNPYVVATHHLTVVVCPPEGSYYRPATAGSAAACTRIYEYTPAPGQFINEGAPITTPAEACAYAAERLAQGAYVSLGGFGGYLVAGFDHSIDNDGGYNLAVTGNSFAGSSEPGIVWVMQDENGDGLPNDTWYELKGSEYGKPETDPSYAVTYTRPDGPGQSVPWRDNRGATGTIEYLAAYHPQEYYYPAWIEADSYTLRGIRLQSRSYDQSGNGTYWVNPAFEWGYADNFSPIDRLTDDENPTAAANDNHFRIADAVTFDGSPAHLKYIDFVKIQVAVNQQCGWIGEVSTEVFGVKDYNRSK